MAVYFENIGHEIKKVLRSAKINITICVAWIDFDIYFNELIAAMDRGVSLRIMVTRSDKAKKCSSFIEMLQQKGAMFEVIVLGKAINCMHNKIAIIDSTIVISGSYNWTHNADNNFENVYIEPRNQIDILSYFNEFDRISRMNSIGIAKLLKMEKCPYCGRDMMNMIVYDEDDVGNVVKMCSFDTGHYINTGEAVGAYLPEILSSLYEQEEYASELYNCGESDEILKKEYELKKMNAIDEYIWSLNVPIHAVGRVSISRDYYYAGEKYIKMIWFNKSFSSKFENDYFDSFDVF